MAFEEDELLSLSGIQHFAFCRRQWALIHIEQQWAENERTADGRVMHEKVHDPSVSESRGDRRITRGMYVRSYELGISGQCDVVEFRRSESGVPLSDREGKWQPFPIEYKRGEPKESDADRVQLCAQAMCLEEMLCCPVPRGALFYGEIHRRENVEFTEELRCRVKEMLSEMHEYYRRGYTPRVKRSRACNACSLRELCVPSMFTAADVSAYLRTGLEETT